MENIDNLFELIKNDATKNIVNLPNEKGVKQQFPFELLHSLWDALLKIKLEESALGRLKFYLAHADIRYFTLKYLKSDFYAKNKINDQYLDSLLSLFSIMPGLEMNKKSSKNPSNGSSDGLSNDSFEQDQQKSENEVHKDEWSLFALRRDLLTTNSNIIDVNVHRKLFNDCFVHFLQKNIDVKLYKKVLVKMPEKILPKMSNPLMMSDFLTHSYNMGGLISVLALNGIFILINNYNLEYPNFFKKLYQLLDASIFHTKYKDKFFQLLDTFLTSTHLSSVLVASFIKKLSRMSLTCPPADLKFLILFIYNLLIRHPNCKVLIHNSTKKNITDIKDDPFDIDCQDFNHSNALRSSLWEIQTLKQHYTAYVSKEVEKLTNLMSIEYQLDDAFENNTYNALIELELDPKKGTPNRAVNYFFDIQETKNNYMSNMYDTNISNILKIN